MFIIFQYFCSDDANATMVTSVSTMPTDSPPNSTKMVPPTSTAVATTPKHGRDSVVVAGGCGGGRRMSATKGKVQVGMSDRRGGESQKWI